MSKVFAYSNKVDSISVLDGETTMEKTINFNPNRIKALRVNQITFSSNIPNVYNYGTTNTGLLRTSKDGGTTWNIIQLSNGMYTLPLINAGIQNAINQLNYWTLSSDPGFSLKFNTATQICYVEIDSTKLAVANQFEIDLGYTGSSIGTLLGFVTTTLIHADGITSASDTAQINWFGDNISVELDIGVGNLTYLNGKDSKQICRIPLSTDTVTNEYVYPRDGFVPPWIILPTLSRLDKYKILLKSGDGLKQMLVTSGEIYVEFQLKEL